MPRQASLAALQPTPTPCPCPPCTFAPTQWCTLDWALQCDPSADMCCERPHELLAEDGAVACTNRSAGDTVCAHDWECYSTNDPCNAFVSAPTCNLKHSCVWRSPRSAAAQPNQGGQSSGVVCGGGQAGLPFDSNASLS